MDSAVTEGSAVTEDSAITEEIVDGLATVTFTRQAAMNSLDLATKELLRDTLVRLADDTSVRAVLLTGTGRAFCVGQDLREHADNLRAADDPAVVWRTVSEHYNPIVTAIATMPKPVVAAVNGVAAGAGASIAFAADFRLLADTASYNLAFTGIGLTTDSGASWTLPRLVGHARATELLMLPETVPAARALELGLANRVVPAADLLDTATAFARRLADGPTIAYASVKAALAFGADHDLASTLAVEAAGQTRCGTTQDHRDAVDAFLAKRRPVFLGR
jgi:2-(1,2-epoxy-1,2-dihydrophenyl)acetyl-CoA isomerase